MTPLAGAAMTKTLAALDPPSRRWLTELAPDHPHHRQAVAQLQTLLLRVARHELGRRRVQLDSIAGPEFDDLAQQAANDALLAILAKLDAFKGLSKFTTWAYKFVIAQVSATVAAHAWRHQPADPADGLLDRLPDAVTRTPGDQVHQREQLRTLTVAIAQLPARQREVFVAVALNDVSIDALALRLGSNRNAIYKNLFDARHRLRQHLADAGHPVTPTHHDHA